LAEEHPKATVQALIFDSDILISYLKKSTAAAAFVEDVPLAERALSAVSYLEVLFGCHDTREYMLVQEFIDEEFAEVIPLTEDITLGAIKLMQGFVLSRRPGTNDVLIAATALVRNEPLATGNRKHFDFVPGLDLRIFRP
jgi:hypothetical protein